MDAEAGFLTAFRVAHGPEYACHDLRIHGAIISVQVIQGKPTMCSSILKASRPTDGREAAKEYP